MKAILFDQHLVEIDPASTGVGGAWQGKTSEGVPHGWDPDLLKFFYKLTQGHHEPIVFDVGANTGTYSLLPAVHKGMHVVAFEPAPDIFELLKKNIELNNLTERTHPFRMAIADEVGTATLKVPRGGENSGLACIGTPLRFNEWEEVHVSVTTIDSFFMEHALPRIDFVKIDTEGCELFVLKGGIETIRKFHPSILLEYHEPNTRQFGYKPDEISALLSALGYDNVIQVGMEDAFFWRSSPTLRPEDITGLLSQKLQTEQKKRVEDQGDSPPPGSLDLEMLLAQDSSGPEHVLPKIENILGRDPTCAQVIAIKRYLQLQAKKDEALRQLL